MAVQADRALQPPIRPTNVDSMENTQLRHGWFFLPYYGQAWFGWGWEDVCLIILLFPTPSLAPICHAFPPPSQAAAFLCSVRDMPPATHCGLQGFNIFPMPRLPALPALLFTHLLQLKPHTYPWLENFCCGKRTLHCTASTCAPFHPSNMHGWFVSDMVLLLQTCLPRPALTSALSCVLILCFLWSLHACLYLTWFDWFVYSGEKEEKWRGSYTIPVILPSLFYTSPSL